MTAATSHSGQEGQRRRGKAGRTTERSSEKGQLIFCSDFTRDSAVSIGVLAPAVLREPMEGFLCQNANRAAKRQSPLLHRRCCILVVDTMFDEIEVEICCQRTEGVDRVFYSRLLMNHAISADVHQSYVTPGSMFDQLPEASDAVSTYIMRHLPKGAEGQLT